MSENVSIQEFFDAPICSGSWKRSQRDETLVRWGHLWKLYDMGIGWDISVTPRHLISPDISLEFPGWIQGGFKGTDFLLAPVDLSSTSKES